MKTADQHAEAHRLKSELGYGARRIAEELGITRHAATQLLAQPLPDQPAEVAEVADGDRQPPADGVAEVAEQPADAAGAVAATVSHPPADQHAPVADGGRPVAATDGQERRPVAQLRLPRRVSAEQLVIDLARQPGLRRDLAVLAQTGCTAEQLVVTAVRVLAAGYQKGLHAGDVLPNRPFQVTRLSVAALALPGPRIPPVPSPATPGGSS